ncbi:hypothetical protein [Clostridium butyricum]|uniref:hypothetical protein n=1 Tax=Clostridium butyricum TaxID=1492 RepID=UPI003464F339
MQQNSSDSYKSRHTVMGIIFDINRRVEEIYKATKDREQKEHRPFGDILQEELGKRKAIKNTDQSSSR